MTDEQKKYHNKIIEKAKQLSEEAEKGDKEQFRAYWIQSAKKNHEAQTLLTADIEKLLEKMMEFAEKRSQEK